MGQRNQKTITTMGRLSVNNTQNTRRRINRAKPAKAVGASNKSEPRQDPWGFYFEMRRNPDKWLKKHGATSD